jgi:hypothetical protein
VCVGWMQHIANQHYIVYRDDDVQSPIDDTLTMILIVQHPSMMLTTMILLL